MPPRPASLRKEEEDRAHPRPGRQPVAYAPGGSQHSRRRHVRYESYRGKANRRQHPFPGELGDERRLRAERSFLPVEVSRRACHRTGHRLSSALSGGLQTQHLSADLDQDPPRKHPVSFQTPITIATAIENIEANRYLLPAIQREFVWPSSKMEWLFDSLMRG